MDADKITLAEAAAILQVPGAVVQSLASRGALGPQADGCVLRAKVMEYQGHRRRVRMAHLAALEEIDLYTNGDWG